MGKKMMSILCILAALFCFLYCTVVFLIKSGSKFYLVWAAGGLCFLGLALMLHFGWWYRLPLMLRRIICVAVTAGIVLFVSVEG